ncbi:MAG: type III-A CRISPR-associated RAMP protein Csm4 [Chloroflexota bacterium]
MSETNMGSLANAKYTCVRLSPLGPFHFGKRGVGLNETEIAMPADGFFSALCNGIHELEGRKAVKRFLEQFPTADQPERLPPLRITSLMPYMSNQRKSVGNGELTAAQINSLQSGETGSEEAYTYLLPMPLMHIPISGNAIANRKRIKSIQWVSRSVFEHLISGQTVDGNKSLLEDAHNEKEAGPRTVENGNVWLTEAEYAQTEGRMTRLWAVSIRPRVAVDRVTSASAVYSSGSVRFQEGCGLYFYIQWEPSADIDLRHSILTAIAYLGDAGIGGERTYGYGHFTPHFEHYDSSPIQQPATANYVTTLAPFLPQTRERVMFQDEQSRYEIILRRGWLTLPGYNNLRRPTVRMVDSGAILARANVAQPTGYLADATPAKLIDSEYTIHRYGICWSIPIVLPLESNS